MLFSTNSNDGHPCCKVLMSVQSALTGAIFQCLACRRLPANVEVCGGFAASTTR